VKTIKKELLETDYCLLFTGFVRLYRDHTPQVPGSNDLRIVHRSFSLRLYPRLRSRKPAPARLSLLDDEVQPPKGKIVVEK